MDELLGKAGEDPLIEDLDLGEAPASGTRITTETEVQQPDTPDAALPEDDEPIPVTVNEDNGTVRQRRFHMRRVSRPMTMYRKRRMLCGAA